MATDAREITRPSVVAHRDCVTCFVDVAQVNQESTENAWRRGGRSETEWKRAIVMLQPQYTCGSCTTFG